MGAKAHLRIEITRNIEDYDEAIASGEHTRDSVEKMLTEDLRELVPQMPEDENYVAYVIIEEDSE